MRATNAVVIVTVSGFIFGLQLAKAQTTIQEYCKLPNATVIVVELHNGKKLELALQRNGNKMSGTVGSDTGSASIHGEFSGSDVYWEVSFQDASKILLLGQFGNGEGSGVISQQTQLRWTARTAVGCARWPDGKPLTAALGAPPPLAPASTQPTHQAPVQTVTPQPQPQTQVQQATRVQAARRCPEGTSQAANGDCVRQSNPLLPFQFLLPGTGGIDIRIGR